MEPETIRRMTDSISHRGPDDFDFFLRGVIDSFGIIEMVGSVEEQFGIELDLSNLDAEQMTILGPLSRYVAQNARPRPI